MKYFDIVTEQDEVIGRKTAQECHVDQSLIHRVVHFTLIDPKEKKILITQRSFEVAFDSGLWCFMGEHVLSGNSNDETVQKGVRNELGFSAQTFFEAGHHIFSYATQTEFVRFFVVVWNGEELKPDSSEIIDTEWVTTDELLKNKEGYSTMTQYWIDTVEWNAFF